MDYCTQDKRIHMRTGVVLGNFFLRQDLADDVFESDNNGQLMIETYRRLGRDILKSLKEGGSS